MQFAADAVSVGLINDLAFPVPVEHENTLVVIHTEG